ncbi:hypothetical protein KG892_00505 [Vermiphilus pyriformis]|nr:MAG: hypothetical protein KG892_00505 [Vermiphilus pyriformis]
MSKFLFFIIFFNILEGADYIKATNAVSIEKLQNASYLIEPVLSYDLLQAAQDNNYEHVVDLKKKGARVDLKDTCGKWALFYAITNQNVEMTRFLLNFDSPIFETIEVPFEHSRDGMKGFGIEIVGLAKAAISTDSFDSFQEVVRFVQKKYPKRISELLSPCYQTGSDPLHFAVRTFKYDFAQRLIDLGASTKGKSITIIQHNLKTLTYSISLLTHLASTIPQEPSLKKKWSTLFNRLRNLGESLGYEEFVTFMEQFIYQEDRENLEFFVNHISPYTDITFQLKKIENNEEHSFTKAKLERAVNEQNLYDQSLCTIKQSPLELVVLNLCRVIDEESQYHILKKLIEWGAYVNGGDNSPCTPLAHALSKNQTKLIQILVHSGADFLHYSVRKCIEQLAQEDRLGGFFQKVPSLVVSTDKIYALYLQSILTGNLSLLKKLNALSLYRLIPRSRYKNIESLFSYYLALHNEKYSGDFLKEMSRVTS